MCRSSCSIRRSGSRPFRSTASSPTPISSGKDRTAGRRSPVRFPPAAPTSGSTSGLCRAIEGLARLRATRPQRGAPTAPIGRLRRCVPTQDADRSPVLALVPVRRLQPGDSPAGRRSGRCTRATGSRCRSSWICADIRSSSASRRHCDGRRAPGRGRRRRGQRPLVYVALGSHANFFGRASSRSIPRIRSTRPRQRRDVVRRADARRPHRERSHRPRPGSFGSRATRARVDDVRRRLGRGRLRALPGQRADRVPGGSRGAGLPRAVAATRRRKRSAGRGAERATQRGVRVPERSAVRPGAQSSSRADFGRRATPARSSRGTRRRRPIRRGRPSTR